MELENTIHVDFSTGLLRGRSVIEGTRDLASLKGCFRDERALAALDPSRVVYRVQAFQPVPEGIEGGLFWGATCLEPGLVGDEYFMTKGHFHAKRNRAEYYSTIAGRGALILMDEDRNPRVEWMCPGTTHYIPGLTAHRVANIGDQQLSFLACWPSDAGHDYRTITLHGFSVRLRCIAGKPQLVPDP
jgi:glucose-6-phosphate isomerase